MATAVTPNSGLSQSDSTQATQVVRGSIALTANYGGGATHGDTLNLAFFGVQSNNPPLEVEIFEIPPAGTAPSGYIFGYAPGTNASNGVLTVLQSPAIAAAPATAGPLSEYPEGTAYSAALLAAVLHFRATFALGN